MNQPPFAGECPVKSAWGFGWSPTMSPQIVREVENIRSNGHVCDSRTSSVGNTNDTYDEQLANMPEALINTLKKEKKPFTYTPGDVNLSEVLAEKLQKRAERKKKLSMERASQSLRQYKENDVSQDSLPVFESPKQLLVMPTYNTPLNMYSMENALEVLEVQAELAVKDKSTPAPKVSHSQTLPRNHTFRFTQDFEPKNVTQSRAFRVLQVITDTEEEPPVATREKHEKYFPEETRFTGLRDSKTIPSKFFHTLQRITGTDSDEDITDNHTSAVAVTKVMNAPGNVTSGSVHAPNKNNPRPQQQQQQQVRQEVCHPQTNSPTQHHIFATQNKVIHDQQKNGPVLKRPAAFLPANLSAPRIGPQRSPSFLQRGTIDPRGGTDL